MRPEIKAAFVVGAVILAGGIIWGVNSSRTARTPDIPMDVSPGDLKKTDTSLAGDKRGGQVPDLKKAGGSASGAGNRGSGANAPPRPHTGEPLRSEPKPNPPASPPARDESRRPAEVVIPGGASLGARGATPPMTQPGERPGAKSQPAATAPAEPGRTSDPAKGDTVLTPSAGSERPVATPPKSEPAAAMSRETPPLPRTESPAVKRDGVAPASPTGNAPVGKLDRTAESTYTVVSGDSYSSIARQKLGRESRWKEIAALNPGIDPTRLREGQKIRLPAATEPAGLGAAGKPSDEKSAASGTKPNGVAKPNGSAAPTGAGAPKAPDGGKPPAGGAAAKPADSSAPTTAYKVGKGETLVSIAKKTLGDAGRWNDIYELNRDKLSSPDKVRPGMELKIPAKKKP